MEIERLAMTDPTNTNKTHRLFIINAEEYGLPSHERS